VLLHGYLAINQNRREKMSRWERIRYSFVASVIAVGVFVVVDIIFSFDIGEIIFSPVFFVPTLVVFYLFAPYISNLIRYK
jgi:hypothetical protein